MGTEANENCDLNDRNSLFHQEEKSDLPKKEADDDKKETEFNPPSQPAEEHLITEAEDLPSTDSNPAVSSYEDTDQGPEEIDPVNHPRDFHHISPEKSKDRS